MRIVVGLIFFSLACSERKGELDQNTNVVSKSAAADERVPSGNYLGRFAIEDGENGVYLRLKDSSSALYHGLGWLRICELVANDTIVSFRTAPMFGRAFTFNGKFRAGALHGKLTRFTDTLDLVFRRFDKPTPPISQSPEKSGFYSNLQYIEEAGDNVGQELLVGTIGGQPTAAFMMAEGTVSSPQIGFNMRGSQDTLLFDISRDSTAPHITAVFGDSAVAVSLGGADRSRLPKRFSLVAFFDQPAEAACAP
jgi:hypothetical protein